MTKPRRLPLLSLVAFSIALGFAEPDSAISQNDASAEEARLRTTIEQLDRDLERERESEARLVTTLAGELTEIHRKRDELAKKLLDAELLRLTNSERIETLRSDVEERSAEAQRLVESFGTMTSTLHSAATHLRVHLRGVPGKSESIEKLATLASSLELAENTPNATAIQAMLELFAEIEAAHDGATRVGIRKVLLPNADGKKENVELLSIGHVRHAYSTTRGAVGLTVASPEGVEGYRWTEDVPEDLAGHVRSAVDAARSGRDSQTWIPLDPSGRIGIDSDLRAKSLWERLRAGGSIMFPLAGVALVALLLVLERFAFLYLANRGGSNVALGVVTACRSGDFAAAERLCAADRGVVARVLETCLARRSKGGRAMEDAIQEQLLHELPRVRRFLGGIAILAAIAPLLGLLGTVTGIIQTFGVVEAFGNANPSLMSGGISEALVTTATGLVIAVPILALHSVLRGRSDALLADSEKHAATLLGLLSHESAPSPPPATEEGESS